MMMLINDIMTMILMIVLVQKRVNEDC